MKEDLELFRSLFIPHPSSFIPPKLPFQSQHQTVQSAADTEESDPVARPKEFTFLSQGGCEGKRNGSHIAEELERAELFFAWNAESFQDRIAMPRSHLMADHFVELIFAPTDLVEKLTPGAQTQIDTILEHFAGVRFHERDHDVAEAEVDTSLHERAGLMAKNFLDCLHGGRQKRLHAPAAECVVL